MKIVTLLFLVIVIVGCGASLTRRSLSIDYGMSKDHVVKKMGIPEQRSMRDEQEALQYSEVAGFGQCSYITIWLSKGNVIGVTTRSGPSIAGCGLGSKEVNWNEMPNKNNESTKNNNTLEQ